MRTKQLQIARSLVASAAAALLVACAAAPEAKPGAWTPNPPNPSAPYPAESREKGEQGTVLVRVRTTPEGRPAVVEVFQSSGYPRLDRAATETAWKWQYEPLPDTGAVVWREVPFSFFITTPPPRATLN